MIDPAPMCSRRRSRHLFRFSYKFLPLANMPVIGGARLCRPPTELKTEAMRLKPTFLTVVFAFMLASGVVHAAEQSGRLIVPNPKSIASGAPKPASIKGTFTLVSVGDLLYSRPVSGNPDGELRKVLDIVKAADVAIGNQEGVFFDLKNFGGEAPGSPAILRGELELAADLKAIGIDMVSTANNHSNDWDSEGLVAMEKLLGKAGVVHAGGGRTLADARAARFLQTPMGRVALVATASTFKEGATAQDAIDGVPSRTGISTLRTRAINVVTQETMAHLRAAAGAAESTGDLSFGGALYRVGLTPRVTYEMNTFDHYEILKAIREGKQKADLAVFTIHAHENADGMDDERIGDPGDFLIELFHDAVDAGADVIMGGGPHSLRGIEIYKGKPIFYGLGVFFINADIYLTQEERTRHYGPAPTSAPAAPTATARPNGANPASWYDGIVATTTFRNGAVKEIRLYPLDLGQAGGPGRKGLPHLASPERARAILESLQRASAAYGTTIAIENSVGVLQL